MTQKKINLLIALGIICQMFFYSSCALPVKPQKKSPPTPIVASEEKPMDFDQPWAQSQPNTTSKTSNPEQFSKEFKDESKLDDLLENDPLKIAMEPNPAPTTQIVSQAKAQKTNKSEKKKKYRIQLLTVSDIETAQEKKRKFAYLIGAHVDVYFDAPFYKLRFGYFSTKRKAEEKLLDLTDLGINGFVIKEK